MTNKKQIAILGATGSIGTSTLSLLGLHSNLYGLFLVCANKNWHKMVQICNTFKPKYAVMIDEYSANQLRYNLKNFNIEVLSGQDNLISLLQHTDLDYIVSAIVGAQGILANLAALKTGKRLLLANKESLVLAGDIFMETKEKYQAELIPIDSEHSGIFQCLQASQRGINEIVLTASGGPFLNKKLEQLNDITPQQALKHPNWRMGDKISIDSATIMNKGLEIIEAYFLFGLELSKINAIIHPQSVIHSLLYFHDGSILSHLSMPDMRIAISYGLSYPDRIPLPVPKLSLIDYKNLSFSEIDEVKYPCFKLAKQSLNAGNLAMGSLNAANEICVYAFLDGKISFMQIPQIIEKVLNEQKNMAANDLEEIIENDLIARQRSKAIINELK